MYNYLDDTFTNESDTAISVGTPNTQRLNMHNTDPDFHQVKRTKKQRGHFILEYYETKPVNDFRIRNAVTGVWYRDDHPKCKYLVGSAQEDVFFKVHFSTGEPELTSASRNNRKNTTLLFYDSPEQFERHQRMTVAQSVKEKWQEKNQLRLLANHKIMEREQNGTR
jgi:hypothetical protein